ncbi:MAG: glycosyltransferase [Verrucomicrobia bacterium]|nr:glycosyltransferase [Verrucomicrobiota bacterium]
MSGGPNSALLLAAYLCERGEWVRLISTNVAFDQKKSSELYAHIDTLFQRPVQRERILLVDGLNQTTGVNIGANDLFFATAWWTAQIARDAVKKTIYRDFIYLIQDFEPLLHSASSFHARALETYGLPHIPVINTKLLLDHLAQEACGCYRDENFVKKALYFEPAIDRASFFPTSKANSPSTQQRKVLLFYARPTMAQRNLFEVGLIALRRAVAAGYITDEHWEVLAIGEKLEPISLGNGVTLKPVPWMSFNDYAERIRTADLLLSLMLSPHPSYPPLEMAASGNLVVTNSYSVKDETRLRSISPNIIVAAPNVDSIASALQRTVGKINAGLSSCDPTGSMSYPSSWHESFSALLPQLEQRIHAVRIERRSHINHVRNPYLKHKEDSYTEFKASRLSTRRSQGPYFQMPGLLSFVSPTFNTSPEYLEELAASVFLQDGGTNFEWLILDNGSTDGATIECLRTLAKHPCVRLERVDQNLGIIGGMRYCLEHATGRYIIPLDSDDVIEPDCVHVLTKELQDKGFPALAYTDEDKLDKDRFVCPYFKPDWDPVLFLHSCYIAHLCVIDREKGLSLGLYSDKKSEGCHDWDSFIRFMNAGYFPHHIPEVLYSWRIHQQSTAQNIGSKSFISSSHQALLSQFLKGTTAPHLELTLSSLFSAGVDWWFKRKRVHPKSYATIHIGNEKLNSVSSLSNSNEHFHIDQEEGIAALENTLIKVKSELVHIVWDGIVPDGDEWSWDAMGLMDLFPDTVMVGGSLHDGTSILGGPMVFGFGNGCDCPDRGRQLGDPGFFAQMWKPHSVSAISSGHCVVLTSFLKEVIPQLISLKGSIAYLGPCLGALAREGGKRVLFSPFMRARARMVPESLATPECLSRFLTRFWNLIPDEKLLSPRLGINAKSAYLPVPAIERLQHLENLKHAKLPYPEELSLIQQHRIEKYPLPAEPPSFTLLTTIYERTNMALLDALAESIMLQSLPATQWVIVAHGPIPQDQLEKVRSKAKSIWQATLIEKDQPLGIIGAMRLALDHAHGAYIVPVDADDLITVDALQILAHEIKKLSEPDLIYSDEDLLIQDVPCHPYSRGPFDPLLHSSNSCIWHLCAIKRESALHFNLYTDPGANWCHDWDTVLRISEGRGRIEYVSEVLYHWRQHPISVSNKPTGESPSLDSVRHELKKHIAKTSRPDLFFIDKWPICPVELYIARREREKPPFVWMDEILDPSLAQTLPSDAIVVVTSGDVIIDRESTFNEVARIFELYPDVGAVGGRVIDKQGKITDGCYLRNGAHGFSNCLEGVANDNPGKFNIFFKIQTASKTGSRLAFFRLSALVEKKVPFELFATHPSSWISGVCEKLTQDNKWRIAYSPRVSAQTCV